MTTRIYPDPEGQFKVEVPNEWLLDASGQAGVRVAFVSPHQQSEFRANVNVVVQHVPPLTKEEYVLLTRLQLKQLSQQASLNRDELLDSGAYVFDWINHQSPVPVWVRQQVFFSTSKAFTLTATCILGQEKELVATFDSILNSFEIDEASC